ncbi:hypothetical protein GCM10010407_15660 [Rarobacter incanus]
MLDWVTVPVGQAPYFDRICRGQAAGGAGASEQQRYCVARVAPALMVRRALVAGRIRHIPGSALHGGACPAIEPVVRGVKQLVGLWRAGAPSSDSEFDPRADLQAVITHESRSL